VLFEDCMASSSLTAPSHMSLFTGQTVHRHGLVDNETPVFPETTLASELARHGWRTAAFTGHGSLRADLGHGVGFETFESWVGEERWPFSRNLPEVLPRATRWLDERDPSAPFFLFVHGYDPHCPYAPPEPWRAQYAGWYAGDLDADGLCGPGVFRRKIEDGSIGRDELRLLNDLYDAEIRAADEALGAFLDALRERGLLERSILVFTSDHGESIGHHEWVGHGQMWNEMLHVPFLVRFPEGRWAGRQRALVQTTDVLPTLLSALGLSIPDGVQGMDLLPLLRDGTGLPAGRLRVARSGSAVAVRFGLRWSLLLRDAGDAFLDPMLFDLRADPGEHHDLAADEASRSDLERLLARYADWRRRNEADDARFRGRPGDPARGDPLADERLRALGYAGDDEDPVR